MKNGGFRATSSNRIISAAFYSAVAEFAHWVEKHSDLKLLSWLQSHVQANPELGFAYLTDSLTEAMADLDRNWNIKAVHLNGVSAPGDEEQEAHPEAVMTLPTIKCLLATDPKKTSQKSISNHNQKMLRKGLFDDLDQSGQQRLQAVSRQTSPLADSVSQIIPFSTEKADALMWIYLRRTP